MAAPSSSSSSTSSSSSSLSFVHQNLFRIQECNFILHLFLSEFSFTLFICVCVPPCDCLVALYLLLRLVHPSADSAVDSCVSAER